MGKTPNEAAAAAARAARRTRRYVAVAVADVSSNSRNSMLAGVLPFSCRDQRSACLDFIGLLRLRRRPGPVKRPPASQRGKRRQRAAGPDPPEILPFSPLSDSEI